jgi:hypothetical protein
MVGIGGAGPAVPFVGVAAAPGEGATSGVAVPVDCVGTGPDPFRRAPGGTYAPGVRTTAENLYAR